MWREGERGSQREAHTNRNRTHGGGGDNSVRLLLACDRPDVWVQQQLSDITVVIT